MKLVNPAGRNMNTLDTEAYRHRCVCSRNYDNTSLYGGTTGDISVCGCQCSYGPENSSANANLSGA